MSDEIVRLSLGSTMSPVLRAVGLLFDSECNRDVTSIAIEFGSDLYANNENLYKHKQSIRKVIDEVLASAEVMTPLRISPFAEPQIDKFLNELEVDEYVAILRSPKVTIEPQHFFVQMLIIYDRVMQGLFVEFRQFFREIDIEGDSRDIKICNTTIVLSHIESKN